MGFHFADRLNSEIKKNTLWFLSPNGHLTPILFIRLFLNSIFHKQEKSTFYKFTTGENNNWIIGTESLSAKNIYYSPAIADHISGLLRISILKPVAAKKYNESV
jgi:hypothetical protein